MNLKDQARLSCYEELAPLSERSTLVRDLESGQVYVRRKIHNAPVSVLREQQERSFHGLPKIELLIEDGEECIIIEEYISGYPLSTYIERGGLTERQLFSWMQTLLENLSHLHESTPPIVLGSLQAEDIRINDQGKPILMNLDQAACGETSLIPASNTALEHRSGLSGTSIDVYHYAFLFQALLERTDVSAENRALVAPALKRCLGRRGAFRYPDAGSLLRALGWGEKPDIYDETEEKPWLRFLPPGFQTTNLVGLISAASWYGIMFGAAKYAINVSPSPELDWLFYAIGCFALLLSTFFVGNYLNVWRFTPLVRSKIPLLHWGGIVFWTLICYWGPLYLFSVVMDWLGLVS